MSYIVKALITCVAAAFVASVVVETAEALNCKKKRFFTVEGVTFDADEVETILAPEGADFRTTVIVMKSGKEHTVKACPREVSFEFRHALRI